MPRVLLLPPPGFDDLSVEEKLGYVQSLWDRITTRPEEVRTLLTSTGQEKRLAAHRADPSARVLGKRSG